MSRQPSGMLKHLDRAYLALFREYPLLVRLGIITGAGQIAFALLSANIRDHMLTIFA